MTCHVLQFLFAGPDVVGLASLSAVSLVSGEAAHSLRTSDVFHNKTDLPGSKGLEGMNVFNVKPLLSTMRRWRNCTFLIRYAQNPSLV